MLNKEWDLMDMVWDWSPERKRSVAARLRELAGLLEKMAGEESRSKEEPHLN